MQIYQKGVLIPGDASYSRIILTPGEVIAVKLPGFKKEISIDVTEEKISIHQGTVLIKEIDKSELK